MDYKMLHFDLTLKIFFKLELPNNSDCQVKDRHLSKELLHWMEGCLIDCQNIIQF